MWDRHFWPAQGDSPGLFSLLRYNTSIKMSSVLANFSEIVKDVPPGAWAAISEREERVIVYGRDLQTVLKEARERGEPVPLMVKVPERPEILFFPCGANATK